MAARCAQYVPKFRSLRRSASTPNTTAVSPSRCFIPVPRRAVRYQLQGCASAVVVPSVRGSRSPSMRLPNTAIEDPGSCAQIAPVCAGTGPEHRGVCTGLGVIEYPVRPLAISTVLRQARLRNFKATRSSGAPVALKAVPPSGPSTRGQSTPQGGDPMRDHALCQRETGPSAVARDCDSWRPRTLRIEINPHRLP